MSSDNPFYHRGALRQADFFYGRQTEITQVLGLLRNGQSVSLIGPRRIGKSSLLIHLVRPEIREPMQLGPNQALFVLLDCQEFGGSPPEELYEAIFDGLLDTATEAGLTVKETHSPGTYRAIDRL